MSDTRYTREIAVSVVENRIVVTMHFDGHREHFMYSREVARDLALKLLQAIDQSPTPPAPPSALGISVAEDIKTKEAFG